MRSAAAILLALTLGACATMKPAPVVPPVAAPPPPPAAAPASPPRGPTVISRTPTPVKEACVPKAFPRAPKYPDTDVALRDAGGAADRYQLLAAGRLLRERRLGELEKIVESCR